VPTTTVQAAVMQARRDGVDGIVSFGGGSAADTGKAVCFFTEQEQGQPGASFADRPVLPHVSITTTYSGAELTPFFGMTDPATRQKNGAGGPTIAPMAAFYDPMLTLSTPGRVSAETGMNALAHCVEVIWSPHRTPEAEAVALAGAARIVDALPRVVDDPDTWVDLERDRVAFDGKPLRREAHAYFLLYKPKGYLTTYRDPQGRKTIYDLLPDRDRYLFPVGRLDLETSGLLLLTNDTQFAEQLTNPEYHVPKTYQVKASKHLADEELARLRAGLALRDGPTRPANQALVPQGVNSPVWNIPKMRWKL